MATASENNPRSQSEKSPQLPWPAETSTSHTYQMHCHCGTLRWSITISPPLFPEHDPDHLRLWSAVNCQCSYCQRNGILPIHPRWQDITWREEGLEHRKEYLTASKKCPQWFCGKCGSTIGTDLRGFTAEMGIEERVAVNLRMLKDFDISKIQVKATEGMNMKDAPPHYPPFEI